MRSSTRSDGTWIVSAHSLTASRPMSSPGLSNDPDILSGNYIAWVCGPPAAARHLLDWRSGKARVAIAPGATALRGNAPGLLGAIAASADPKRALNARRHRRAPIERSELLSSARSAARACPGCLQRCLPTHRCSPISWPAAGTVRRVFDASAFAMPPEAAEFAEVLDRDHARPSL